jgi:hypothetical protein
MNQPRSVFTPQQLAFQEIVIGTLIYSVVLGFFNDYTTVVEAKSFSTIFFAALVLELLTYATLQLKRRVVVWLKKKNHKTHKLLVPFCIWLIMFVSKFVFIWVLDVLFGSYIAINGFFGILLVVVSVTALQQLSYFVFRKLGSKQ